MAFKVPKDYMQYLKTSNRRITYVQIIWISEMAQIIIGADKSI